MYFNLGISTFLFSNFYYHICAANWNRKAAGCHDKICSINDIEDPGGNGQWYLFPTNLTAYDMNVLPAWCDCITGLGITVAVVDQGVSNHTDLRLDFTLGFDPLPDEERDASHGTKVAGVIAAKRNGLFGIGIAYDATIVDVRVLTSNTTPEIMERAFTVNRNRIDIYSNSYTNFPNGISIYPLHPLVEHSLRMGTQNGRNGLGSIFVWSTGNGGGTGILKDYCSYEGLNNNPWVIPVAGAAYNLKQITSGEQCSAIFISAFTKNPEDQIHNIVTTVGINRTTVDFGRNSAAVPMVSGAIALALQANPNLTYRDVMHLLVLTARNMLPFNPNDFQINGAGIKTSPTFGFGLLDIGSLVLKSKIWINVPGMEIYTLKLQKELPVRLTDCIWVEVKENVCKVDTLEHVSLFVKLRSDRAGFLKVSLISPCGTRSTVIPGRKVDRRKELAINVTSVQFWGENPIGIWILQAEDEIAIEGNLITWDIHLFGIKNTVLPIYTNGRCSNQNLTCNIESIGYEYSHDSSNTDNTLTLALSIPFSVLTGIAGFTGLGYYFYKRHDDSRSSRTVKFDNRVGESKH